MIDAKDLQIGDFVCYSKANNYITKVEAINNPGQTYTSDEYDIKCHRDKNDPLSEKNPIDYFNVEILYPIQITRDILKANGWITDKDFPYSYYKIDDHNQLEYYHYERRLRRIYEGVDEWENHSLVRDITFQCQCTYVHQLQHALKMAGVLNEIKL